MLVLMLVLVPVPVPVPVLLCPPQRVRPRLCAGRADPEASARPAPLRPLTLPLLQQQLPAQALTVARAARLAAAAAAGSAA